MDRNLGQMNIPDYTAIRDESICLLVNLVNVHTNGHFQMVKWSDELFKLKADVWNTLNNPFSVLWNISMTLL